MTHTRRIAAVTAVALLLGFMGQSGIALSAAGATVSGVVQFEGTPPAPQPVNFGAEKQCALIHGAAQPVNDIITVGAGGGLRSVVVSIKEEVPGPHAPPAAPVIVDQHGCLFSPRVAAVMAGQPVEFRNDDPVLHNVRAMSKKKQSFNIAQPTKGMKTTRTFKEAEAAIPLKCDVHFWMVGFLHVFAHPFFAVTGDDGAFTIPGLPDGTYTLEAWHEKLGAQTQTITVKDGAAPAVTFRFSSS